MHPSVTPNDHLFVDPFFSLGWDESLVPSSMNIKRIFRPSSSGTPRAKKVPTPTSTQETDVNPNFSPTQFSNSVSDPILLPRRLSISATSRAQLPMALPARYGHRVASSLLRQRCFGHPEQSGLRALSTQSTARFSHPRLQTQKAASLRTYRAFSTSLRNLATQSAPSAESYLASGAVKGAGNLVDVKKVLVIGSGGLSIGQAGEFDYSGAWANLP